VELDEMQERLQRFLRARLHDPAARVVELEPGSGHAGFSYLFGVLSRGERRNYYLRLPPPNVKWEGTADVLRQVCALNALQGTAVPHAPVLWSGDDLEWFGCPYMVQPRLEGDVLRDDWITHFTPAQRSELGRQTMTALAGVHRVDWQHRAACLGTFWGFELDITRWDRFYERSAEQQSLTLQPRVRQKLLDSIPGDAHIGLYHGDCNWSNVLCSEDARVTALIDWELTGIGATLNDVGWLCAFSDPDAWPADNITSRLVPHALELEGYYREAWGADPGNVRWFKALAMYKFAIIGGFNLMLHRRGKRIDPHWEEMMPCMQTNMEYAAKMLSD
jgi:aminoglycoside phosphotransferase (APT) family kinase protein